jgi:hypothetical protein
MSDQKPNPYKQLDLSDEGHDANCRVAERMADITAKAYAKDKMRMKYAHQYLVGAHIFALMEGAGTADTEKFLNELTRGLGLNCG